ncbi:hypothetical protein MIND_00641600 [Mycena indigotica]|uniref:Dynamin-type G domain-containing protein n=1 Tax=Mycena indigotica TaxID=2126181 RepID=A0A8H6SRD5_9AGAR|nr:uncharacterized protein MIND_00641600 [Mycena indigotica]KAF7304101.1 hypothetical protein MIND_00641600 [Mycena indigotica]
MLQCTSHLLALCIKLSRRSFFVPHGRPAAGDHDDVASNRPYNAHGHVNERAPGRTTHGNSKPEAPGLQDLAFDYRHPWHFARRDTPRPWILSRFFSSLSFAPPTTTRLTMSSTGLGLSDPSAASAQARRAMLDLVNRLQNTGVQLDIDLPRIAVIGNQSAGKSSLIEAISGISLPRASGTCTRCPTECRLSRSDGPWKCTVELHLTTDKNGLPIGQAKNIPFGAPILDKKDVEERIRRAQRAILNPSQPAESFLSDTSDADPEMHEVSFSKNFISLSISGRDLADLSFVDLPGLIASVSDSRGGKKGDIAMVEGLVTWYISKPSCVILLAVACETDFENQRAHNLTKEWDPEGKRTVGVLTKPDRIPLGDEGNWLPLIRNEREALVNNWFCVKQPAKPDLDKGITWKEARESEDNFFALTPPWSTLDPLYQKYLRTPNLVERLGSILSDLISKRLPKIQGELERAIQQTYASLRELPRAPSSDPVAEVAAMLSSFVQDLNNMVLGVDMGDDSTPGLIQSIRPAQEKFRKAIQGTAPNFSPPQTIEGDAKCDDSDDDDDDDSDEDTEGESVDSEGEGSSVVSEVEPEGRTIYVDEVAKRANEQVPSPARESSLDTTRSSCRCRSSSNSRRSGDSPRTSCATRSARSSATTSKPSPRTGSRHSARGDSGAGSRTCGFTAPNTLSLIPPPQRAHAAASHAAHGRRARAHRQVHRAGDAGADDAQRALPGGLQGEVPGALPREQAGNSEFAALIRGHRAQAPEAPPGPARPKPKGAGLDFVVPGPKPTISSVLGQLASLGLPGVAAADLAKLLPSDKMEPALEIMADVRAYFQVAYKRVSDNVPLAIDHELVRGARQGRAPAALRRPRDRRRGGGAHLQRAGAGEPQRGEQTRGAGNEAGAPRGRTQGVGQNRDVIERTSRHS